MTTFAGSTNAGSKDGVGTNAKFGGPRSIAMNPTGSMLYVVDLNSNIKCIALSIGIHCL